DSGDGEPQIARLVASQLKRMRRIVDAAVDLAEQGGFEAVRLRDVAENSDVALGTLYKYFRSKEDLLLFAFIEDLERLERVMVDRPTRGKDPLARIGEFFRRATRGLAHKPQLTKAMLRASAGGDAETALRIAGTQLRVSRLIVAAMRGEAPDLETPLDASNADAEEGAIAAALVGIWFSSLVGWSGGLIGEQEVTRTVCSAAKLMLRDDTVR
ncbi:MAG: TetR/AcrR family transcriptional regulator, partial [bacterium]|nr:TetR/AcrR family transcriptional regulator [bacterium]